MEEYDSQVLYLLKSANKLILNFDSQKYTMEYTYLITGDILKIIFWNNDNRNEATFSITITDEILDIFQEILKNPNESYGHFDLQYSDMDGLNFNIGHRLYTGCTFNIYEIDKIKELIEYVINSYEF